VNAVGRIQHQLLALSVAAIHHLVIVGGAKKRWQGLLNSSAQRVWTRLLVLREIGLSSHLDHEFGLLCSGNSEEALEVFRF